MRRAADVRETTSPSPCHRWRRAAALCRAGRQCQRAVVARPHWPPTWPVIWPRKGQTVSLLDLDPLQSSASWVRRREQLGRHDIHGLSLKLDAYTTYGRLTEVVNQAHGYLIIDSPGGLDGPLLDHVLRVAQVVLVPVLPSPIDIRAATRFLQAVMLSPCYRRRPRRLAVVANRTRARTRMYEQLRQFLTSLKIPLSGDPARHAALHTGRRRRRRASSTCRYSVPLRTSSIGAVSPSGWKYSAICCARYPAFTAERHPATHPPRGSDSRSPPFPVSPAATSRAPAAVALHAATGAPPHGFPAR